jgi:hypothetical protein
MEGGRLFSGKTVAAGREYFLAKEKENNDLLGNFWLRMGQNSHKYLKTAILGCFKVFKLL